MLHDVNSDSENEDQHYCILNRAVSIMGYLFIHLQSHLCVT